MASLVKTRNVAETLQVAPKTVQTWVRKHNIPVKTNDRGHYLYDRNAIERLRTVKSTQMPDDAEQYYETHNQVTRAEAENRMDEILRRLDHLEKTIEKKADEVVSFQLLKHREELDDVQHSLTEVQRHVDALQADTGEAKLAVEAPKKERGKFASMFLADKKA
ncbi:MerR family transcriptional regulator [Natribacillus halophilus]|uniref:Chromosome-anchoring protein RacA n=1 Tax=Natribacillus halophilus TaxID=549003 RepID=A0A1G8J9W0_9BACI|nr:MerR family transcriptional regulator [Natribacillus halophilus]SDI27871.1 chromosome-anchoring protein RacA [Natribacillus halophilus]